MGMTPRSGRLTFLETQDYADPGPCGATNNTNPQVWLGGPGVLIIKSADLDDALVRLEMMLPDTTYSVVTWATDDAGSYTTNSGFTADGAQTISILFEYLPQGSYRIATVQADDEVVDDLSVWLVSTPGA